MYVFIDESGIHKTVGKSSIALVYVLTAHLGATEKVVVDTERELRIRPFHWAHSAWPVREKFVRAVASCDMTIKVAFITNPFSERAAYENALKHMIVERDISHIVIDGRKSRRHERNIKKTLRDKGISVRKLRTVRDEAYPALRIADAVAGLVRYRHDDPADERANALYRALEKKISIILEQ